MSWEVRSDPWALRSEWWCWVFEVMRMLRVVRWGVDNLAPCVITQGGCLPLGPANTQSEGSCRHTHSSIRRHFYYCCYYRRQSQRVRVVTDLHLFTKLRLFNSTNSSHQLIIVQLLINRFQRLYQLLTMDYPKLPSKACNSITTPQ